MGEKKLTIMVLKVEDLQCPSCYKKVKKVLCKFPEIRNQVYDEKQNTVTITVLCCSPERIRDKLCCKGGKTIKSIEIVVPPPPVPTPKPAPKPAPAPGPERPRDGKPKTDKPPEPAPAPPPPAPAPKPKEPEKPKSNGKPEKPPAPPVPAPVQTPACPPMYPVVACYPSCYEGVPGGQCYQYGRPVPWYDYYGYGPYYVTRCDYFSEENPTGCTIM